jgi:farnesyl-diphosphate farnesyltransferase
MNAMAGDSLNDVETWSGKGRDDENFPVGSQLIRKHLRPHIHAFYRFARNADDIADHPDMSGAEKIRRLDVMRDVLLGVRRDGAPSAAGLRASLLRTGITPDHATDLLRAFRQDAEKSRYASYDELYEYCRYSAMPVGRYVLDLHGEDRATWVPSDALCAVLQILNHLQDASVDLNNMDRCYLPADLLADHGASIESLRGTSSAPGLTAVKLALLDRCDALLRDAGYLPRLVTDRWLRIETAIILRLARKLSARLRRGDPVAARVKLQKPDFAVALLKSFVCLP